ncbi:MAG: YciI family protein [Deltaproteobacteria bacterium]|nr:YciI family protein [Deltaproteobacteria bacterium]
MEFMLLFLRDPGVGREVDPAMIEDLRRRGALLRQVRLADASAAAVVRVRDGQAAIREGSAAASEPVLDGFWILDVASRDEADDIARRCSEGGDGTIELHRVAWRAQVPDPGGGEPFLFAFRLEPGPRDPDGSRLQRMLDFTEQLKRDGCFIETAPLAADPPPLRLRRKRDSLVVSDGPFAETKEGVGGYALVRLAGRAAAIELATRYPHAGWGPVEVRAVIEPVAGW